MTIRYVALAAIAFVLAACAQPEPEPLPLQPTYDKIGNASCPAGYQLATDATGGTVCQSL